jgi:hypothetical protein
MRLLRYEPIIDLQLRRRKGLGRKGELVEKRHIDTCHVKDEWMLYIMMHRDEAYLID